MWQKELVSFSVLRERLRVDMLENCAGLLRKQKQNERPQMDDGLTCLDQSDETF